MPCGEETADEAHRRRSLSGLTRPEDAEAVNAVRPDYAGFVCRKPPAGVPQRRLSCGSGWIPLSHDRGVCE